MADLQIFTALGILIAGYGYMVAGLESTTGSEFKAAHWQMLTYLAWLSSVTHLAGLSTVRHYLKEHIIETRIRAGAMGILILALIIAMAPSAFINRNTRHFPAYCFYQPALLAKYFTKAQDMPNDLAQLLGTMLSIFFVVVNFLHRIIRMTKLGTILHNMRRGCSEKCQTWILRLSEKSFPILWADLIWHELFVRAGLSAFLTVRMLLDFLLSMFFEVMRIACIPVVITADSVAGFLACSPGHLGCYSDPRHRGFLYNKWWKSRVQGLELDFWTATSSGPAARPNSGGRQALPPFRQFRLGMCAFM